MTLRACIITLAALPCVACGRVGFDATSTTDATSTNDATASNCFDRPGVLFCDGFEGPGIDAWNGGVGAVTRETSVVHSGAGSLRSSSDAAQSGSGVWQSIPDVVSGSLHTRAWFYVPSGFFIFKVNLIGDGNPSGDAVVFLIDNEELRAYAAPPPGAVVTSGITVPRDRWFCIELHADVAATATGSVALDLDGAEIGRMNAIATLPAGNLTAVSIGPIYVGQAQEPLTIYIDDVVTGTEPVGCS